MTRRDSLSAAEATIGPEGFDMTWSNGHYTADSHVSGENNNISVGTKVEFCAGTREPA